MKNGESMLIPKDRFMLASFAKALNAARNVAQANAKDPDVVLAEAGPNISALAQAAGYGAWPRKLWPSKPMMTALTKSTMGDKGAPVPWADPKSTPWYDPVYFGAPASSRRGSVPCRPPGTAPPTVSWLPGRTALCPSAACPEF